MRKRRNRDGTRTRQERSRDAFEGGDIGQVERDALGAVGLDRGVLVGVVGVVGPALDAGEQQAPALADDPGALEQAQALLAEFEDAPVDDRIERAVGVGGEVARGQAAGAGGKLRAFALEMIDGVGADVGAVDIGSEPLVEHGHDAPGAAADLEDALARSEPELLEVVAGEFTAADAALGGLLGIGAVVEQELEVLGAVEIVAFHAGRLPLRAVHDADAGLPGLVGVCGHGRSIRAARTVTF